MEFNPGARAVGILHGASGRSDDGRKHCINHGFLGYENAQKEELKSEEN